MVAYLWQSLEHANVFLVQNFNCLNERWLFDVCCQKIQAIASQHMQTDTLSVVYICLPSILFYGFEIFAKMCFGFKSYVQCTHRLFFYSTPLPPASSLFCVYLCAHKFVIILKYGQSFAAMYAHITSTFAWLKIQSSRNLMLETWNTTAI